VADLAPTIDPQHSALLVMDYQVGILARMPNVEELLAKVAGVITLARRHGMPIGYVRVAFDDADYAALSANNKGLAGVAAARRMYDGDPDTAIHELVAPEAGDIIVRKTRVGAFSTTDLDQQLRARGITTLILAGLSTSGVVLSTVRDGADRDYRLYVLVDGCGDPDPEVHEMLTQKLFPRQADVITIAELSGLLPVH
jgi:nicotinamidase-related amidase